MKAKSAFLFYLLSVSLLKGWPALSAVLRSYFIRTNGSQHCRQRNKTSTNTILTFVRSSWTGTSAGFWLWGSQLLNCTELNRTEPWASAHKGKWGQLTPWKWIEKLKSENIQERAVFYVCVIFWEGRQVYRTALCWPHNFYYRAMLCIRGTSHGPVSVRLSVCLAVRHKSVFY